MYIQTDRPIQRLKSDATNGEVVEFSDTGTAQVTQEIGAQMIDRYDAITETDN